MIITKDTILEVLGKFELMGIVKIEDAIKYVDKNDISYLKEQREIKFKGHSVIHDIINKNLRLPASVEIAGLKRITYSKRFKTTAFHYQNGDKIEKKGDEAMFDFVKLTGDEVFRILNF